MFCNRCGTQMQPDAQVCSNCGRRIGDPTSAIAQSRLERHLHILAIFWIAVSGLFLIPAVAMLVFAGGIHLVVHGSEPLQGLFPLFLDFAGASFLLIAAGGICVGLGLMQRRSWARIAAIILGVLALFHPPFGTALGIYTLWVLLADEHGDEYRYLSQANS
ncbi:MAG TPA: zinc ribbon domain-containing protein [Verrucomicrobiae bacterium]|nr:zinc ribbon domain-containing protein [Verrucomicrobiae bacterium]